MKMTHKEKDKIAAVLYHALYPNRNYYRDCLDNERLKERYYVAIDTLNEYKFGEMVMAVKYIHVNMHKIRANRKHGTNEPVLTVKEGRKNTYGHSVKIHGPSEVIYGGNDKPLLPCGARVVIKTEADVEID